MGFGDFVKEYSGYNTTKKAVSGDLRGAIAHETDKFGLTSPAPPDLSQGEDAQRTRDAANVLMADYKNRQAGVAPITDRTRQQTAYDLALNAANGGAPTAADAMLRKGVDENVASQLGIAATLQGSRPGAALRAGLTGAQKAVSGSAADAAALRANEIAAARGQTIDAANAIRSGDLGDAGNAVTTRGQDIQQQLGLGNLMASSALAPYNAALANQQLQLQNQAANQATTGALFKSGAALIASDERVKEDIKPAPEIADDFLESLKPKTYRYKNPDEPGAYPGTKLGTIAQDMVGGVTTGPDGKKYISADVIGRVLAGMGRLNERLDSVEGGR